jgi:hypothetical protein
MADQKTFLNPANTEQANAVINFVSCFLYVFRKSSCVCFSVLLMLSDLHVIKGVHAAVLSLASAVAQGNVVRCIIRSTAKGMYNHDKSLFPEAVQSSHKKPTASPSTFKKIIFNSGVG